MKIRIPADTLKALLLCAPKVNARVYLRGVLIDVRADDVTLVATTGTVVLAVPVLADDIEDRAIGQYIIPRELIESVKPMKVGRVALPLEIIIGAEGACSVQGATTATGKLIDGHYPDWRRVMPATASGEAGQFDAALLSIFADVAGLLGGKSNKVVVHHNGLNGTALVTGLGMDARGVIAPVRATADDVRHPGLPAWCKV